MKSKHIIGGILCTCAALTACTSNAPWGMSDPLIGTTQNQKQFDGQILGDLMVINKNEIAAAKEARIRSHNPEVLRYAAFLERQHTENLQKTIRLSKKLGVTAESSNFSLSLEKNGQQELVKLRSLNDAAFDKAYINAMVKGHQEAINFLNQTIAKSTNAELTHQLQATRAHVQIHLNKALMIQKHLG